jgi:F-type H+-transporting ATPase subunit gamma
MPSLLDIRRRIRSVKNTQQLTKAMKTVSAAKLRRAQERVFSARPYAEQLRKVLGSLAATAKDIQHPLLEIRPQKRILTVVVTADRGLCGGFNSNLIRAAASAGEYINFFTKLDYGHAKDLSATVVDFYTKKEFDAVYLVYNEFKSVIQQRIVVTQLLPLAASEIEGSRDETEYIYEQKPQEVFDRLLPRYVETQVYRSLLESAAAEHGARMAAMDTASRNAGEMIESLTLNMNRIRQAAITREIIEVVSGAGAQ